MADYLVGGGLDLALVRDATGLIIIHAINDKYRVAEAIAFKSRDKKPLNLATLCQDICRVCKRHGLTQLSADGHEFEAAQQECAKHGVELVKYTATGDVRLAAWAAARTAFTEGRMSVPLTALQLKRELKSTAFKLTPGGRIEIVQPRKGGTHCDMASALILALWSAKHLAPVNVEHTLHAPSPTSYQSALDMGGTIDAPARHEVQAYLDNLTSPYMSQSDHEARMIQEAQQLLNPPGCIPLDQWGRPTGDWQGRQVQLPQLDFDRGRALAAEFDLSNLPLTTGRS